ncbi:MAG: hypothetical protein PHX44_04880 [Sulfurimonas sp.]|uniref:hypothetical protein n=1 Tax=Sulfurimonas sp. TaxID=2022749 RepID=UPI002620C9B8|nr:hypothetical protein [Sulfurimonas sp.]MDD2652369.1 hypothetical protein [Sulfurimonas sp.]MDD3451155.1 hypothetical protein [Sulfurimonas sp.]
MVKITLLILTLATFMSASSFEENCLKCHSKDFKFAMMMKKYTQNHSSERKIKEAIFDYLKNPSADKSVLPYEYINRFGVKEKTTLDDATLREMIDIYYKMFNIKERIY